MKLRRLFLTLLVTASAWSWSPAANATPANCPYASANDCVGWMFDWWQMENGTYWGIGYLPTGRLWTFSGNIAGGQHTVNVQVPPTGFAVAEVWVDGSPYGTFPAQLVSAQKDSDQTVQYAYPGGWISGYASAMTLNLNVYGTNYQISLSQVQNHLNSGLYCFSISDVGATCSFH